MVAPRLFVLDANAFIQAKRRFYAFDVCPGYWNALIWHHNHSLVRALSIDKVKDELERGKDDLWNWAQKLPTSYFASTDDPDVLARFGEISRWVHAHNFTPQAKADFAGEADGWLIAYAKAKGRVVVTQEEYNPQARNKVPIPNICREFKVEYVNTFDFLRELSARFDWQQPE